MNQPLPDTDLVVSTPERVSFDYQVAGLGTRAIAQLLDLLILAFVLGAVAFAAIALGQAGMDTLSFLVAVIGAFVVIFGYFWACEAFWSGQTLGKKVFRLRAVGDRGEPMTFSQAGIRNIVRIVDFLPYAYGVGLVVLFINGKGKRLGDLAAGTIAVKDSDAVWLWQLPGGRPEQQNAAPPATEAAQTGPPAPSNVPGPAFAPQPAAAFALATPAELALRMLDPELRRFVTSYARRRPQLPLFLRSQLAGLLQNNLQAAAPDVFTQNGPLAALDHLADLERQ
ncbi:MAG TPA: RDD family protein [Candidatus Dormibacteraeota bacterium]|nr:RDD family protein [Candidatus Dormibacteraeota bacterium]